MEEIVINKLEDIPIEHNFDWDDISKYQKLSEDFIREFHNKVNWNMISKYQKLSEDFIKEFENKVDWDNISMFQKLSEYLIREFHNKVKNYSILNVVHNCGKFNRQIYIKRNDVKHIHIGCSIYTKDEAIKAIKNKYLDEEECQLYIDKVKECFNI